MQLSGIPGRTVAVALLAALLLATSARADTLNVPAQHATIQAAIVAAEPGDTVLVAPGTYVELIDFLGKAITVESSGGAAVTTIDGNGGGSVVRFHGGEGSTSVLEGFTITGGTGTPLGFSQELAGGGILVQAAVPVIRNCVITGNSADGGAGVFVTGWTSGSVLLEDCVLSENSSGAGAGFGGLAGGGAIGLYDSGRAELHGCTLEDNTSASVGGGFYAQWNSRLFLFDCQVRGNTATGVGGGGAFISGFASAFTPLLLEDCEVSGNSSSGGGGVSIGLAGDGFFAPSASLRRCRFEGNTAGSGGAIRGSGSLSGGIHVTDCWIVDNVATISGGGAALDDECELRHCTLMGNTAPNGGGVWASTSGALVGHSIVWGSGPSPLGPGVQASWSDVQGGASGLGNFDVEPHFVDPANGDYHLAATSACVDAGDPAFVGAGLTDIDGDPRVLFGHVDVGADEATFPKGAWTFLGHALAGAGGTPSLVGTGTLIGGTPMTLELNGAAPSSSTWLVLGTGQLRLPFKGGVMVPTIDMLIGPIGSGPAGGYALNANWPAGLPPGFVVRLQTWIADASGPAGFTASNGLAAQSQ